MIRINGKEVQYNHFPDGTLLLKESVDKGNSEIIIKWNYENNEELLVVYFLTKHIQEAGFDRIILDMPYIPNARQDRVKNEEDVFTLKYFAELINALGFSEVRVLDAHSSVSLALIDRVKLYSPEPYIRKVIDEITRESGKEPLMFYPDEGAAKRYGGMIQMPYCFGIKNRDWESGEIKSLDVAGEKQLVSGSNVLVVDDICSYGGTFLHSADNLKQLGADKIYLYVSHCEMSVLSGQLIRSENVEKIFTTDSIWKGQCEKVEVITV